MSQTIELTDEAAAALKQMETLLPEVEPYFLVETALSITAALYEKSVHGAVIQVKTEDGKTEELRFKIKKPARKKANKG